MGWRWDQWPKVATVKLNIAVLIKQSTYNYNFFDACIIFLITHRYFYCKGNFEHNVAFSIVEKLFLTVTHSPKLTNMRTIRYNSSDNNLFLPLEHYFTAANFISLLQH